MISVEEAVDRIAGSVSAVGVETVPLLEALDRILARDVVASLDVPRFSHATVDGFAIHREDVEETASGKPILLRVIRTVRAGSSARRPVKPGTAIRIMTGAPVPAGTHAVVKEEHTTRAGEGTNSIRVERTIAPTENVAAAGHDVRRGDLVLAKGSSVGPGGIACMASLGVQKAPLFRKPRVALLSTGAELVSLEEDLGPGKIFASSFYFLYARLRKSGCVPVPLGITRDNRREIERRIRSGLAADAIITVGGTRRGDSDWVKNIYDHLRIDSRVDGVAVSPGKSFIFGLLRGKPLFSLPGTPSACMVAFEELVRPALGKMRGEPGDPGTPGLTVRMPLAESLHGERGLRKYVLARVTLQQGKLTAIPLGREHRGALTAMVQANGMVILSEDTTEVETGEDVPVRLLDWRF